MKISLILAVRTILNSFKTRNWSKEANQAIFRMKCRVIMKKLLKFYKDIEPETNDFFISTMAVQDLKRIIARGDVDPLYKLAELNEVHQ